MTHRGFDSEEGYLLFSHMSFLASAHITSTYSFKRSILQGLAIWQTLDPYMGPVSRQTWPPLPTCNRRSWRIGWRPSPWAIWEAPCALLGLSQVPLVSFFSSATPQQRLVLVSSSQPSLWWIYSSSFLCSSYGVSDASSLKIHWHSDSLTVL